MNKNIIIVLVVILVIGAGVYLFKNQNSSSSISTPTPTPSPVSSATLTPTTPTPAPTPAAVPVPALVIHNVNITGFAFSPASITARKGDTIIWTNKDSAPHTVTGEGLNSPTLGQNQTYSFIYDKTGTFTYHCNFHPNMTGTIKVTN